MSLKIYHLVLIEENTNNVHYVTNDIKFKGRLTIQKDKQTLFESNVRDGIITPETWKQLRRASGCFLGVRVIKG